MGNSSRVPVAFVRRQKVTNQLCKYGGFNIMARWCKAIIIGMQPLSDMPLVSIVTPSYNTGRFIEQTLRSVKEQDYPLVEHIVLDSGSTDETSHIIERFPTIRLIRPAPQGLCEKVNQGLSIARGDIVGWLNADDYYLPGAIAKAVQALKTCPEAALVYCNFLHVDEQGDEIERMHSKQVGLRELLREQNYVPHQTAFMRSEALQNLGPVDVRYPLVSDWDLWIRISKNFPLLYVDDWWGAFRIRNGQMSEVNKYAFWSQAQKMTREHGASYFSPLFWSYWHGKLTRAGLLLRQRQFKTFNSKLRDFVVGFGKL
jgi:glycosyltransferase involved in cell wall biosynthesis